jgi:hypothetical protein
MRQSRDLLAIIFVRAMSGDRLRLRFWLPWNRKMMTRAERPNF